MFCVYALFNVTAYLAPSPAVAIGSLAIAQLCGAMTNGPLMATIQTLIPSPMRAMSLAILYLFANLIGMGLGPFGVGMISDTLAPSAGTEALRFALLVFSPGYLWAAWHIVRAGKTIMSDLPDTGTVKSAAAYHVDSHGRA